MGTLIVSKPGSVREAIALPPKATRIGVSFGVSVYVGKRSRSWAVFVCLDRNATIALLSEGLARPLAIQRAEQYLLDRTLAKGAVQLSLWVEE